MRTASDVEPRRGAMVGLGGVARQSHLPAFQDPAVARRLAITSAVDPAAAGEVVAGVPVLADVAALGDALAFVDIATPPRSHAALVRWALERGLHVLCEKPVATTRAEALALTTLAEAQGAVLFPCHQYRFNPVWRRMRGWLADGALGRWHLAEIAVYRTAADRGAAVADDAPWRTRRDASGGGVLVDHGTHLLYTLLDLGGTPSRVRAWTSRLAHRRYEVEDTAHVCLDWGDDRIATLALTWAARRRETRVHVVGDRGSVTWVDGALTLERDGRVETYDCTRELDKAAYASWFGALFLEFADALDEGPDGPASRRARDDVVAVASLLEAAYASAESGSPVTLV